MMSSRDDFLRVPKVTPDGSNWISVKDRFRWAANARGQLNHIEGGASEPMPPVPSARTPGNSGAEAPESQAETDKAAEDDMKAQRDFEIIHARWLQNEAIIKQAIANMVPDLIFNRIKMKTTAKEVWDALVNIYEARSLMVAIDLRKQLEGLKCGERDDFRTHFDKPGEQCEKLASVGIELPDTEYVNIILGSMPSSYDPTISSMTAAASLSGKPLTPEIVTKVILDEYDRHGVSRKKLTKDGEKDIAFSAGVGSESGRKAIKCFNCGKEGHKKADCWASGGGKEGQAPRVGWGGGRGRGGGRGGGAGRGGTPAGAHVAEVDEDDEVWAVVDNEAFL